MTNINIDYLVKLFQCIFYTSIPIITVLTYIKAKRGLLSSVNTEYHKKVIERLDELSRKLLEEYDINSPNHWIKKHSVDNSVDIINKTFIKYKKEILRTGKYQHGIPITPDYTYLNNFLLTIKSDPFIPKIIRDKVTNFLEFRTKIIFNVYISELTKYGNKLAKGIYKKNLKNNKDIIHNIINDSLHKQGCGIEQIEKDVHEIRYEIQRYFERFFPN